MHKIRDDNIYPDVKLSRPNAFWNSCCIDCSPSYVEKRHKKEPAKGRKIPCMVETFSDDIVHGWNDTTQSKGNKDSWTNKWQNRV